MAHRRGSYLALAWMMAAGFAHADPPAKSTPPPPPPDDSLIEFLGSDDTGDAKWWEFLKRSEPNGEDGQGSGARKSGAREDQKR